MTVCPVDRAGDHLLIAIDCSSRHAAEDGLAAVPRPGRLAVVRGPFTAVIR